MDTILLLSVEYVGFFQGKIVERESHEMIKLTPERKVWGLNNSEHFVRMDKICSKGMISSFNNSGVSADYGGRREYADECLLTSIPPSI